MKMNMTKPKNGIDFDPYVIIKAAMKNGGEFADIYFEDTSTTSVVCEENRLEKVLAGRDRGCGVRVISGLKTFYAYTNDLSGGGLMEAAATVAGAIKDGSPAADFPLLKKVISTDFGVRRSPSEEPLPEKVALVKEANRIAWSIDDRVKQVKVVYGDSLRETVVVNSEGRWVEEKKTSVLLLCQVIAESGGVLHTGYEPVGGALGLELFDEESPEKIARAATARALLMLGARRAPGGKMGVVLSSEAGGTMIHEAIGHGLEADLAEQGLSVYAGKIGERVATDLITVIDDGTIPFKRGSSFFDGEGSATQKTTLVENGILQGYMHDRLSAMKANTSSTGNGRRESYHHRPVVRMTNTMIAPGTGEPSEIVRSLDSGLLVRKMGGGQVNTVTGDFVFEVTEGYLIENGEVGEPVRGATLTGNGPEVLNSIDMVGSDLGFGIGTCGKDGQGAPVADAQPTIRIPSIVVGGGVESS